MKKNKKQNYTSGQFTMIVILAGLVVLTIGLAVISRITVDTKIASQSSDSTQAMAAAEAGVEYAYALPEGSTNCDIDQSVFNNTAKTKCTVEDLIPMEDEWFSIGDIETGESRTVWFVGHSDFYEPDLSSTPYNGKLSVKWTPEGAILGFTIFYDRTGSSDYALAKEVSSSYTHTFDSADYPEPERWIMLRIKNIKGADSVTVNILADSNGFPSQGKAIDSLGTVIASRISKRIVVSELYPALPSLFDYVILSQSKLK